MSSTGPARPGRNSDQQLLKTARASMQGFTLTAGLAPVEWFHSHKSQLYEQQDLSWVCLPSTNYRVLVRSHVTVRDPDLSSMNQAPVFFTRIGERRDRDGRYVVPTRRVYCLRCRQTVVRDVSSQTHIIRLDSDKDLLPVTCTERMYSYLLTRLQFHG